MYQTAAGVQPFAQWFAGLDETAGAEVATALERLYTGNTSNVRAVGAGVSELKIHFGPGYRVYFGWQGLELVILLGGGTKARQSADIATAQARWADYKQRRAAPKPKKKNKGVK